MASICWTKPSSQTINTFGIEVWSSGNRSGWEINFTFVLVINTEGNEGWRLYFGLSFRVLSPWLLDFIISWLCMVGSKVSHLMTESRQSRPAAGLPPYYTFVSSGPIYLFQFLSPVIIISVNTHKAHLEACLPNFLGLSKSNLADN